MKEKALSVAVVSLALLAVALHVWGGIRGCSRPTQPVTRHTTPPLCVEAKVVTP